MSHYKFDVIVVGAGPAGVAAAGALAGSGISVALLEASVYAGAENWSGCVYFAESLAEKDCFGPDAVAAAPYERKVQKRGTLMHNGLDTVGVELSDGQAFQNCYTVLRPLYDPYFANLARLKGAVHIPGTTVISLIRNNRRVVGVETNRGPLYADVTFIAEGDASHLVRSEQLERVPQPHFLQGVKAVLSLAPSEIEKRFDLRAGEGAAYELLIRNPAIAGRTARLNVGAFLYTNSDSLSIGYVAPLDNIRDHFRGSHDTLYEWLCGLPYIRELIAGATLSAYGTKIIRSGGWRERPVLVEHGLAVGGAATGLGIDLPFPNFTGPASATGLYFARAVKNIMKRGSSFDAGQLTREYVGPLSKSVYGRNAEYLSRWPGYFGRSKVLFGRTVDIACGTAHFLASGSLVETGRFLRGHVLSFRGVKELVTDTAKAISSLRLWKPVLLTLINPATIWQWTANTVCKSRSGDLRLRIILRIGGKDVNALSWPARSLIKRLSPALVRALQQVYANDGKPLQGKFSKAARHVLQGIALSDLVVLPAYALTLFFISLGTAVVDAFRFYILKTPVEKFLAETVMAYAESQKKIRDLDRVKPSVSLDAKLATNTYRVGNESHIRTLWPESIAAQPEMAQAGLWWVCPARVYVYDPPPFAGRGKVTVNYENCIKCESCWRAEPSRVIWGRHTDHKLIYRPESGVLPALLKALRESPLQSPFPKEGTDIKAPADKAGYRGITSVDERLWYVTEPVRRAADSVLSASAAFNHSVQKLPPSADRARRAWPISLGKRLAARLAGLETALSNDGRYEQAQMAESDRKALEIGIAEGRLFHALYCSRRIQERVSVWMPNLSASSFPSYKAGDADGSKILHDEVSRLFPDRIVKQWEDAPMPEDWATKLRVFVSEHLDSPHEAVRALSSVNPALGLIAAHQIHASRILTASGFTADAVCSVDGRSLVIDERPDGIRIKGNVNLVPAAASRSLLILSSSAGYLLPYTTPCVAITPAPSIGFRAAGLSEITIDCTVRKQTVDLPEADGILDPTFYLSIALGAADYLCRRVKAHAAGRIQFSGQMLDTEGRDGIVKLGAVKALIARTEAWRLLLETLYRTVLKSEIRNPKSEMHFSLLCSALAAKAFGPEPGSIGYDAGQVFGGFAYSEDDLLSRFYRDSSLFRFLSPGYGAAERFNKEAGLNSLDDAIPANAVHEEPLGPLVSRLKTLTKKCRALSPDADPALAGEANAMTLAIRLILLSIEQALNQGQSKEAEAAAVEVLLGLADEAIAKAELSAGRGSVSPSAVFPVEPVGKQVPLDFDYSLFCNSPGAPHKSGTFLLNVFDRSPRFVPEMQMHDVKLRARWTELVDWFRKNCIQKQFDGLSIERYIEKIHRLPEEVVGAAKQNKWLATYIPQSLDGLDWHKAEYYILNSAAGSFGDASIDLLIMASTSIGTTPILLGLEEELPRVREELAPLVHDERKFGEIGSRLDKIIRSLSSPNPSAIKKEYEAVMKMVDARIRHTRVVKYLAANFLRAFYGAGMAGRRGDFGGFIANLKHAGDLFAQLMPDVRAALEELPRRERCHKLFLRYLGHGAVSAFALTEPTAGSDSGGVKTTAKLQSAKLTPLDDGRYSFNLNGDSEQSVRYLVDSDKIALTSKGIAYETPDGQCQPIRYDKYDYRTDQGIRYYSYNGKECEFHDIGQVRPSDSGPLYEYYSMTGAKMWITNGSIATQFCLYAQTPEGVTGFMVDRHTEGLKVGADEKKTGQRGSPTNEISIDSVRVPREAVIGYEGHGQVNALETLNVGRCGLAVVSGALMRKLMREATETISPSPVRDNLLGEAAAVLFGSESLAYYLVGLFDRPHESVRMESAIAKYVCSEDIHEVITIIENAYGPAGQTEKFLLEKARRDSRVLTIYEGTNEVQRFLILKDLVAQAAAWPSLSESGSEPERTLAVRKNRLRDHVKKAALLLGDTCWSDAMLQPALFPLAEMAGEILRLECIYYRIDWIETRRSLLAQSSADYAPLMLAAAKRAAARTVSRLEYLEAKYLSAWETVRNNIDLPEVRTADAALDQYAAKPALPVQSTRTLKAAVRVLSIIRPVADLSPRPKVVDHEVRELIWRANPSDLAALMQALQLKRSGAAVIVDVLMPGGAEHDSLLRMAGGEAENLYRVTVDPATGANQYLKIVRDLNASRKYDVIIIGDNCSSGDENAGPYLAGSLKRYHYRRERLEVNPDGTGFNHMALPAVMSITETTAEIVTDMNSAVESSFSQVQVLSPDIKSGVSSRFELASGGKTAARAISSPLQAAEYLKIFAASASAIAAPAYTGELRPGSPQDGNGVWAILDPNEPKSNLAVLRASATAAHLGGRQMQVLVPAPGEMWQQLLGLAKANGCVNAFCIDTGSGRLADEGMRELIRRVVKSSVRAIVLAGPAWSGPLALTAGELANADSEVMLCPAVTNIEKSSAGSLMFASPVYNGKLIRRYEWAAGSVFVTIAPEADFAAPAQVQDFTAFILDLAVAEGWIEPLPPVAPPTLSQADVIIDLGYGVKDRAGFELAQELKRKLEALGLAPLFGATRKVTQDLKLLPLEAQIGQTGVRVNPKLIIAVGISGAPQHIDYIGARAEILCFNKDADAPLMKLNQTRPSPRVYPILGDLFVTVREMIEQLG